ncbi:uncharacterized protein LOC119679826 [Teleopsis dalmanni]|uniref:uncharacterized protein LOC119679826 n=1 Tax=Teleopsis dalmanni TaxID=139649 RepID=UPI0018CDE46E|nr:uncharacterized protein LOC119679826 [Teleopsis dalmanni]
MQKQQQKQYNQFDNMFIPISPQAHTMPPPSGEPWSLEEMPWNLATTSTTANSGVMEFTGTTNRVSLHQKRKSGLPVESRPTKQYISEEKFTAHFNGLHISSEYIQDESNNSENMKKSAGKCFTNLSYQDYQLTAKELEQKLKNANRISVCDELKKLQGPQKNSTFLPQVLMNRYEKPCTALVLWKPPSTLALRSSLSTENDNKLFTNKKNDFDSPVDEDFESADSILDPIEFSDNNNIFTVDLNNLKPDSMDEDL